MRMQLKMLKRYSYFYLLLGVVLFAGCGGLSEDGTGEQRKERTQSFLSAYLGDSDQVLVRDKGTGIENIAVIDGKEVILSRVYQEKFLRVNM